MGRHYEVSFGRLFKVVDFAEQGANVHDRSTVCLKRLIFQPIRGGTTGWKVVIRREVENSRMYG